MKFVKRVFLVILIGLFFIGNISAKNSIEAFQNPIKLKNQKLKLIQKLIIQNKTEEAIQQLYKVIDEVEAEKDTLAIINSHRMLADILRENGNYKKSNLSYNYIIPLIKTDYETLQYIYFKKGGNFQLDAKVDSALANYLKAVELNKKVAHKEDLKAKIHANLAGIYYLKEDYDKAIANSKIAANYQKILGNKKLKQVF